MFHAHPQYGPQLLPYHLAHVREGLLYLCQRRVMFRRYIEEQPVLHDAQMGSQLQHRVIPLLKLQLQGILYLCNQLFGNEDIFHIDVLGRAELAQGHPLCMDKEHFILIHVQTGPVQYQVVYPGEVKAGLRLDMCVILSSHTNPAPPVPA